VCRHLEERYRITQRCTTKDRGDDIVATHPSGITLRVEAKGEGSNTPTSARFGKPFTWNQCISHLSRALYSAAAMVSKHSGDRVAMAFPNNEHHRDCVDAIRPAVEKLGIAVFWVDALMCVEC
jgi:hypothetical protein